MYDIISLIYSDILMIGIYIYIIQYDSYCRRYINNGGEIML